MNCDKPFTLSLELIFFFGVTLPICLDSPFDMLLFVFSGVDEPDFDPLFNLSLSVGRHCYGSNLATSVLFVQQDSEINRQNEDRFQVSGLPFEGRPIAGIADQKTVDLNILSDLLALWYPTGAQPRIIDVFLPRKFVPPAVVKYA